MSGSGGCCWALRPGRWAMAGSGWWRAAAGVREATVSLGARELESGEEPLGRARRPGGGPQAAAETDPGLVPALLALVEPEERGDPESPLRWTGKSVRTLAGELTAAGAPGVRGHGAQAAAGRGVQPAGQRQDDRGQRSTRTGTRQFRYINEQARAHLAPGTR